MSNKFDYVVRSLSRGTHKKYETYVINSIYTKLNNEEIEFATQKRVHTSEGTKYIDMYFPQIKVAVEVDEGYHLSLEQKQRDQERMDAIKTSVLESTITDSIHDIEEIRIPIYKSDGSQFSLAEINKNIDEAVSQIKHRYESLNSPKWIFDEDDRIKEIQKRGYLQRGDYFSSMVKILHIFGKEVNGWQKCSYDMPNGTVWSPYLSVDNSSRGGWVNRINGDLTEIYESGIDKEHGKFKSPSSLDWDRNHHSKRFVFLKYKDALGNRNRRFIGVYTADRFDPQQEAEVWKLTSDKLSIK